MFLTLFKQKMNMLSKFLITFLILLFLSLNLCFNFIFKSNEFELQDPTSRRIVAIGDLHGDYRQTIKVLHLTGMINDNKNWTGRNGILIQTVILTTYFEFLISDN